MPAGSRLRTARLGAPGELRRGAPARPPRGAQRPRPARPAWAADPARRPALREGLARWAPATLTRESGGSPGSRGNGEGRLSRSPRRGSVRRWPQPLARGACFQIPWSSRGRVSFRRPETTAPPPPRRAHVTATRSRAQPGRREGPRQAPPPGGGGRRRKPRARAAEGGERWALRPARNSDLRGGVAPVTAG